MKKAFQYIGIGFVVFIAVVIILGNIGHMLVPIKNKEQSQTLEKMIAEVNRHLPHRGFDGFDFFIMNKVLLEGDNVVWVTTLDTTFFYPTRESVLPESMNGGVLASGNRNCTIDLDTILSNDFLKKSHRLDLLYYHLFVRTNNPNKLYEEIMKRQYSQTWRIHSPFSDRRCEFSMTYREQKDIADYCFNNTESALQEFLFEYLKRQNRLLDVASNNADMVMSMAEDGSSLIFYCVLDKLYSLDGNKPVFNIRNNQSEMRDALVEDFQELPLFFGIKEICERTSKRFLFRYTDWNKTDSIDFIIY